MNSQPYRHEACLRQHTAKPSVPKAACRNLRKFYNIREPKHGEAITYDRWYYITYGIIDGLNHTSLGERQ